MKLEERTQLLEKLKFIETLVTEARAMLEGDTLSLVTGSPGKPAVGGNVIPFPKAEADRVVESVAAEMNDVFREALGGATPVGVPGGSPGVLRVLQDRLVGLIDEHYTLVHDSVDKLGCKGDCYRCPHPEFATADEQVRECLKNVVEGLDLDRGLLNEEEQGD